MFTILRPAITAVIVLLLLVSCHNNGKQGFVYVKDGALYRHHAIYTIKGANYWYAMHVAIDDEGRSRIIRDLDEMQAAGINNLRIQASSEGGNEVQYGVKPGVHPQPGEYDEVLLKGLDFVLDELRKRDMQAVLVLNNYWPWSGGMAKYLEWFGAGDIPFPNDSISSSWGDYMRYTDGFYANQEAVNAYRAYIKMLVKRRNTISGTPYYKDPVIMSWQLANEPRSGTSDAERNLLIEWIQHTASYIKKLAPRQLVSSGSEGSIGHHSNINDWYVAHKVKDIDYLTIHMWPQNWQWFDAANPDATYQHALTNSYEYMDDHIALAIKMQKPIVLEEFGFPRDSASYEPEATVYWRNRYYTDILQHLKLHHKKYAGTAGFNFWAWSGSTAPPRPGEYWEAGDPLLGDPPHEPQGWYSVYSTDTETLQIVRDIF